MIWRKEDAIYAEKVIETWDGQEQRYAHTAGRLRAVIVERVDRHAPSAINHTEIDSQELDDHMIKFPPPLDWFQKKLWRIRWMEYMIVLVPMIVFDSGDANLKDHIFFIFMIPLAALVYTFTVKYILLICLIYPFKLMAFITGDQFGFFSGIVKFMEAIGRIINDINNRIIAKFCEEKPEFDPGVIH